MKILLITSLCIFIPLVVVAQQAEKEAVAVIRTITPEAFIIRQQASIPAEMNMKIWASDGLKTGPGGSLGVIFSDDTTVSMGPNSEFFVQDFQFNPAGQQLSFWVKMMQGTFSFLSGQMTKLAPEKVKLETPDATIGLRGTHVLVKVEGGAS